VGFETWGFIRTRARWAFEDAGTGVDPQVLQTRFGRRVLGFGAAAILVGTLLAGAVAAVDTGRLPLTADWVLAFPIVAFSWWESRRRRPRFLPVFATWVAIIALPALRFEPEVAIALVVPLVIAALLGGLVLGRAAAYCYFAVVLAAWGLLVVRMIVGVHPGQDLGRIVLIQGAGIVAVFVLVSVLKRVVFDSIVRYVELFDSVPVGLYRSTREGRILAANRKLADMLGYETVSDLLAVNARDLYVDPEVRDRIMDQSREENTDLLFQLVRRDGRPIWVRETNREVRNPDGSLAYYEGAIEDVTDRIRAEQSAARAQRLFAISFESAPVGMALVASDGRFLRVNRAFCELFRRSAKSFSRLEVDQVLRAADDPGDGSVIPATSGRSTEIERKLRAADGSEFWGRISLSSVPAEAGRDAFLVLQVSDVTAQRRLQEHLEDLVRAKDEFIASVSHEIRTPLTAVVGFASELQANVDRYSAQELVDLLGVVAEQAGSVSHIVEDLLVAARADIGRLVVDPRPIDVRQEVERAIFDCEHERRERGAVVKVDGDPAHALADPGRFRQVVRNLLTNAYRYGGSSVEVRIANGGRMVHVQVVDDGDGVPAGREELIFEPYQRGHDSSGPTRSIGLGLAVSKKLARLMDGDLVYRYEGGRSIFELAIPAC